MGKACSGPTERRDRPARAKYYSKEEEKGKNGMKHRRIEVKSDFEMEAWSAVH